MCERAGGMGRAGARWQWPGASGQQGRGVVGGCLFIKWAGVFVSVS